MEQRPERPVETKARTAEAPAEGERRAQRGYVSQYQSSAAAIYAGLEHGDLLWVGLADRAAGIADDVVLGFADRVVGHQFKMSRFPDKFRLETFLMGANGLLQPLAAAWQLLRQSHPNEPVEIRLVTNDYPSTTDNLGAGGAGHSAAFLGEFELHPHRTLVEWRAAGWQSFVDALCTASGLDETSFEEFLQSFQLLHGSAADFVQRHRPPPQSAGLIEDIAKLLPRLVADSRDKDQWTRDELLHELGWRDSANTRHLHRFPIGAYVQRNVETEDALREAIRQASSGYVSLVGPPGAGKSTLLQTSLEAEAGLILVRYLAFVPGVGQGIGRGEADDFFDDLATQLKRSGLSGARFRDETLQERREQFGTLLRQAGERFRRNRVRTLIVVDGLDHVPREEKPQRSFLAELPLPPAVPEGVLFVLGTQHLELEDLVPAVRDQASIAGRKVSVSPLRREAVHRMADLFGLTPDIPRDRIFDLSLGHPLVARYLIEALRTADTEGREALLAGAMTFEGDIETVYESAWRGIRDDEEAKEVLAYIARAEGPISFELLANAISEKAIERALRSTKHLLTEDFHGWTVFHNSFRQFIRDKPRMRFGRPDLAYSAEVYRELAKLARAAPANSPQRWLELRYLARAQEQAAVLELAVPARFRQQLAEGRSFTELQADIRLAFGAAKEIHDPVVVFRLLLATDEIGRRWTALEQAPAIAEARLAVGDIDGAQAFAEEIGTEGYKVVDALLKANEVSRARALFERVEPLQQLLNGTAHNDFYHDSSGLFEWARRVFWFRDADQINEAIDRLSNTAVHPAVDRGQEADSRLREDLRREVALAIMASRPDADVEEISRSFRLGAEVHADLLVQAALTAAGRGSDALAMELLRRAMAHDGFARLPNSWRRHSALVAARQGDIATTGAIFDVLRVPSVAELDEQTGDEVSEHMARAVLEHAQLAAMLGRSVVDVPASKRDVLRPLQFHANAIGILLGRSRSDDGSVAYGEIAREAQAALTYLEQVRPRGGDEFYAMHQISAATPVLGTALIRAAALCGETEFSAVVAEFDRAFATPECANGRRANLRREVAVDIYRINGDSKEASRRLEPIVESLLEDTPGMQVESLALLATSFARIGNLPRARELLARLFAETLGYALAPKKDPQYATWLELLTHASAEDPCRRAERIALLMRQVDGMMRTEGRNAAYRMAGPLITEAAMLNAGSGLAVGRALFESGTIGSIGWAGLVNALMLGLVKRRPEMAQACVVTWCSLSLPYYIEPYYREGSLGDFIEVAISAATEEEAAGLVETFQVAIETEGRTHERLALLERLRDAAGKRGVGRRTLNDAVARWRVESPPPRHSSTPMQYDEVTTLAELNLRLEQGSRPDEVGYEAAHVFCRLAPAAGFVGAKEVFERWPSIRQDSRARFILINLAIDEGKLGEARHLMQDYWRETDERATWTAWTGGSTLRYFQAQIRLDGPSVHREAYKNFVSSLAAGREMITSVLLEIDDILPIIAQVPRWPAMWDWLAEQLASTREHALGQPFDLGGQASMSDEEMIAALFHWAARMPLWELQRHVRVGALRLNAVPGGAAAFTHLIQSLIAGEEDEPAEALQLLLLDTRDSLSAELGDVITALVDHPDLAVAEQATLLANRWGRQAPMTPSQLSPFYQFILGGQDEDFEPPQLIDPESRAMRIENPLGWTFLFKPLIEFLARSGVSAKHIRHRCRMFIERWGGLETFGQSATDRLQADLSRLEMRMTFARPHVMVAARALRHVAGELRLAGMIGTREVPFLLHMMGFPAPPPPVLSPAMRPSFIRRPSLDDSTWRETEEKWLQGTDEDLRPLGPGGETVIAEVCTFHISEVRRVYTQERMRIPFLEVGGRDGLSEWFELLPEAAWARGVVAKTTEPAPTIVRRLSSSYYMPEIPRFQLAICPHWLRRLGWHSHQDNWLVYLDKPGKVVARIVWWRDGGPVDVQDNVIWGEGVYLSITPAGRAQIEGILGSLTILVNARRDFKAPGEGLQQSRRASSRD